MDQRHMTSAAAGPGKKPAGKPSPGEATKSQPKRRQPKGEAIKRFPIVGVGASAGGLEAFTALLKHLPLDSGMGFVLVQHLDPLHESALTQLLKRSTSMPVREVTNNLRWRPIIFMSFRPTRTSASRRAF
jgi:two-component system CheB/CheR fusion protein